MTTLELEVNGAIRTVHVDRDGTRFVVVLDGRRRVIDAVEIERGRWSLLFDAERHSHEVVVRPGQAGAATVIVDGAAVPVRILDPRRLRRVSGNGSDEGPIRITAPMPGKVVRVLVAPGDRVTARQGLVVVEAMKMENELRAPRDGVIVEVGAREGASVESGAPLITLG